MTKNIDVLRIKSTVQRFYNSTFTTHVSIDVNNGSNGTSEAQRKQDLQAFGFASFLLSCFFLFCMDFFVNAAVTPISKSINDVLSNQIASVTVDGVNVQCVKDDDCKLQYAHFMYDGPAEVVIKTANNISSFSIHPVGRGIQGSVSGNTLTFTITPNPDKPTYLIVRINEQKSNDPTKYDMGYYPLALLGDQPENNVPVVNGSSVVDITKSPYNAPNDYSIDVTTNIQNAIDAISSRSGGGTVYFPAGTYRVYQRLEMKSNVAIYLAPGAHIESDPTKNYATGGNFTHPLIWLAGKENVKFYGRGTLNAKGLSVMNRQKYQDRRGIIKGPENGKTLSKNVVVDGIVLRDGTTWTCDIKYADGVNISNVKVLNHWFQHYQNIKVQNDGINLCSSRNGHVWNNFVMTGDDAFCVKAQDEADGGTRACYNIKNHDNVIFNMGAGNKIGMNAKAEVYDVHFYNNEIIHCRRGIVVESTQSGSSDCCYHRLRDISFSNIRVEDYRGYYDGNRMFNRYYFEFLASRSDIKNITVNNFVSETIAVNGGVAHREGSNTIDGITFNCMKINGVLITDSNKGSHDIAFDSGVSNAAFFGCTPVESVSIIPTNQEPFPVATTRNFTANILPTNATNKTLTWSSNNQGVVSINATTGIATGLSVGIATITATANNGVSNSVSVSVVQTQGQGQATIVALDDFNRAPSGLATGSSNIGWVINNIESSESKVLIFSDSNPTTLQIFNNNNTDGSGANGRSYLTGSLDDFQSPYKKKLKENETITWTFNMRNSKTQFPPHVNGELGLGNNNYAQAVVLVSTNADFLDATAYGYAVNLIRNESGETIFKLVRFAGGLNATSNLTTLIASASGSILSTNWASVKVVYVSATDVWSLHLRDDGTTTTAGNKDPMDETLGAYTLIGTVINNTYTSDEMSACGFFFNHGIARAGSNAKANYDNFGVRVTALSTGYTPGISADYQIRSIQNGFAIDAEQAKVDVYNSIGIQQQSAYIKGTHQFVVNKPGIYILRISTANGETSTKYFVH